MLSALPITRALREAGLEVRIDGDSSRFDDVLQVLEHIADQRGVAVDVGTVVGLEQDAHVELHRAVGADGPSAVVEMPRALVAEENLERIGGGALEMVGPVVFAVDDFELTRLEVDGVDELGRAGGPLGFEGAAGAAGRRSARDGFALGIGGDADEESLVAVEGELAAAHAGGRGERADFAGGFGVEMEGDDGVATTDVGFAGAPGGGDDAGVGRDDFAFGRGNAERGEIDDDDALRGVEDDLVALGGVGVLVEVETARAGVGREADDAVAGIGIDPVGGQRCRWRGLGGDEAGGENAEENGNADGGGGSHGVEEMTGATGTGCAESAADSLRTNDR